MNCIININIINTFNLMLFSNNSSRSNISGDMYRIQNGLPLEGESHSRFISCKPPIRKNKDYRARPRNYFVGFPIYKKDHYTRHWYNLKEVVSDNESWVPKYTKLFTKVYTLSLIGSCLYSIMISHKKNLSSHINSLEGNYVGFRGWRIEFSQFFRNHGRVAGAIALGATSFSFFREYIK